MNIAQDTSVEEQVEELTQDFRAKADNWFKNTLVGYVLSWLWRQITTGNWITGLFDWFFSQIARVSGPGMTIAIAYLIIYTMEFKRSTVTAYPHPDIWDSIAHFADGFVNVAPEIVFPGIAVLGIISFFRSQKVNGWLYSIMAVAFCILTLIVLGANSSGTITPDFVKTMLLWRAAAAIAYTVVVEICHHNKGLDYTELQGLVKELKEQVKSLLEEIDLLRSTQKNLESTVQNLRDENAGLRSTIDQQKTKLGDLKKSMIDQESLSFEAEKYRSTIDQQGQEIESLRSMIDQQKSTMIDLRKSTIDQGNISFEMDRYKSTIDRQAREIQSLQTVIDQRTQGQSSLHAEIDRLNETINRLKDELKKSTEKSMHRPDDRLSGRSTIDQKKSTGRSTEKSMIDSKSGLSKQPIDFQKSIEGLNTKDKIKSCMEDFLKAGKTFTYDDIVAVTGLSIQTVKKYGPDVKRELGLSGNTDEMKAI